MDLAIKVNLIDNFSVNNIVVNLMQQRIIKEEKNYFWEAIKLNKNKDVLYQNSVKYPIEKSKVSAKKYNEL